MPKSYKIGIKPRDAQMPSPILKAGIPVLFLSALCISWELYIHQLAWLFRFRSALSLYIIGQHWGGTLGLAGIGAPALAFVQHSYT